MQNAGRITLTTHNTEHTTASCESFQNDSEDAKSNSTLQWPLGRWGVGSGVGHDSPVTAELQNSCNPFTSGWWLLSNSVCCCIRHRPKQTLQLMASVFLWQRKELMHLWGWTSKRHQSRQPPEARPPGPSAMSCARASPP